MFTGDIVDAAVTHLSARIQTLVVEHFPDDPSQYALMHPTGAVLVAYGGSRFGEVEDLDAIVQDRDAQLDITLLIRGLQGPSGANAHLDAIRTALTGFKVGGAQSKLKPMRERLVGHDNGIWRFEMNFSAKVREVERGPDEAWPLLTRLTWDGKYETTEVTSGDQEDA